MSITEAAINIKYNNPDLDMDLSEQHLISDCCDAGDCQGGITPLAIMYIDDIGVPYEDCFPEIDGDCACIPCDGWENNTWKIADFDYILEDDLKSALYEHGPISISVHISVNDWSNYRGGVYEPVGELNGVHSIVLVGWKDGYWNNSQWIPGYWIIRNSWGPDWGEEGYMRMKYDAVEIGLPARVIIELEPHRISGDVNDDGKVNICDGVLLFNWVSFPNERGTTYVIDDDNADVNRDGKVNIGDAVLLFNWISFLNERGTTYVLR